MRTPVPCSSLPMPPAKLARSAMPGFIVRVASLVLPALVVAAVCQSASAAALDAYAATQPVDTPTLVSPADGATNLPGFVYLDWQDVAGAQSYEIDFVTPDGTEHIGTARQNWLHRPDLRDGVTYSWRVRALGSGGAVSAWSETRSFTVSSSAERFGMSMRFSMVANAAGPVDPAVMAAFAFNGSGFPMTGGTDRPGPTGQVSGATWGIHAVTEGTRFGPPTDSTSFLATVSEYGASLAEIFGSAYEMRFTAAGGLADSDNGGTFISVPFELWSVGDNTFDDASDDVRMIPVMRDLNGNEVFDISGDHPISGGMNDPYSDAITWHMPVDATPGSDGYDAFAGGAPGTVGAAVFHNTVLVNWNGGQQPPYDADLPETGSIIRIESGDENISPTNAAPPNHAVIEAGPVSFFWADREAKARRLQVATNVTFTSVVADVDVTGRTSAVTILTDGTYFWRVSSGLESWSEPWSIQIRNGAVVGLEEQSDRESAPVLFESYPNPAFDSATISFELRDATHVDLAVFDVLGRRVISVVDGVLPIGRHDVLVETTGLTAGTYFYRMTAGGSTQSRKLTIAR